MISEKNDRVVGSSSSSKPYRESACMFQRSDYGLNDNNPHFACLSHNAESRISASLMLLFELEYMKRLQWNG